MLVGAAGPQPWIPTPIDPELPTAFDYGMLCHEKL